MTVGFRNLSAHPFPQAAILFAVTYNMSEWREVTTILKLSKADVIVWIMTFALIVLADLTVAVEIGMLLAALLYIDRVSRRTTVAPVTEEYIEGRSPSDPAGGKDMD